jgi:class 3 adenylate cyclase
MYRNGATALESNDSESAPAGGVLIPVEPSPWFRRRRYFVGRDKTIIGRGSDCQVRVNHPNVSRNHLMLEWIGGELIASHLSPLNATLVNGIPFVGSRQLITGDRIEIAEGIQLRVELFDTSDDMPTERRSRDERRLLAVLHADVVSYSHLVELDAAATARQFEICLEIARAEVASVWGRVENVAGDTVLILFNNTYSAVSSAISWQRKLRALNKETAFDRQMQFRIGISSGDVLVAPTGTLYGDAINIAARIQKLAPPGGVLVAGVVRDELQGHGDFRFSDFRENQLKNLSREIRTYSVEI